MNLAMVQDGDEPITPVDKIPWLRQRESELVKILGAIENLSANEDWSTLKNTVFDGVLMNLEHRMATEAKRMPLNDKIIYQLQGQIAWAKNFSKLESLQTIYRTELVNVRKQLKEQTK